MENNMPNASGNRALADISGVVIDTAKPRSERIRDYIAQVGTPYRYLDGGVVVEIGYADTPVTLQERLLAYVDGLTAQEIYGNFPARVDLGRDVRHNGGGQ